jgi:hypothetical protein
MTDSAIVRLLLKENFRESYDYLENTQNILFFNNTINKWLLSIFIQGISDMYSNFIWDMFLLEGNIVIFKAIYAVYKIIEKDLTKSRTFERLTKLFNDVPLGFNNRGRLAYYLIGKKFNFTMEMIRRHRKEITPQVIKEIVSIGTFQIQEEEEDEKKIKKKICDLDWPLCLKDPKNLEKDYDFVVLKELEEPNIIDDYLDYYSEYKDGTKQNEKKYKYKNINFINDDDLESLKIKYFKEERFKDILIERKKHYCGSKIMSIRSCFFKSEKNGDNKDNKRINIINYFKENKKEIMDDMNDSDERNRRINRIITQVSSKNKHKISFIKEKEEKYSFLNDDKK